MNKQREESLSVKLSNVVFPNPLILPSGIAQEIPSDHEKAIKAGAGGITLKSITILKRDGYPLPRIIKYDHGFLNAVGIRNPGINEAESQIRSFIQASSVPTIVSIFAENVKDFRYLSKQVARLKPAFIEVNLSCPHLTSEYGLPLGTDPKSAGLAIFAVKEQVKGIPVIAKLTPNIPDIASIAVLCEEAGANAISAINTVGPGMVIDIKKGASTLGNLRGGISGPGIKPIAIRCVYDIYEAVSIPIIGMGGISAWEDVVEIMMAGATLVGIGSIVYTKGYKIYREIKKNLVDYLDREKLGNIKNIVGLAHKS
ncbi:dihydroorotate dehydrogenase [Candidatus Gottesmanbacteria bacterium]|nr:dihydroorotate dehydrogenase [Candidatus Gottesmanbacteria bacterium]